MKLLAKTNRVYLLFSTVLLGLASIILYFSMTWIVDDEISESLYLDALRIAQQIEQGNEVTPIPLVLEIEPTTGSEGAIASDTTMFDPFEDEVELFQEVILTKKINEEMYRITVRQVVLEPHDYWNSIGLTLAIVMVLLLVGLLLINKIISKKLWGSFYHNLEILKNFTLEDGQPIHLEASGIYEFTELNTAIEGLTEKVRSDYRALKEFSENASHEIQTPLAIVQTKLQEALQAPNISEDQAEQIGSAYNAAQRLSKLNQTLLLLTKIENRQFTETVSLNIREAIETQLENLQDFIAAKQIKVETDLSASPTPKGNPLLLETLLNNLIANAIKHNVPGGQLGITLTGTELIVTNTGLATNIDPSQLLERFQKADQSSSSLGLGLAIVKRICDTYGWIITYSIKGTEHKMKIGF